MHIQVASSKNVLLILMLPRTKNKAKKKKSIIIVRHGIWNARRRLAVLSNYKIMNVLEKQNVRVS